MSFPQNVNIDDYVTCQCNYDTTQIKSVIDSLDFGDERYDYDYSYFRFVDLNNDGACEILHYFSNSLRGWPYDFMAIYMFENALKKIGDFWSSLNWAESDGRFLQINSRSIGGHKTNPIYYNSVWRFDGVEYTLFYKPDMTKGDFQQCGNIAYKNKQYEEAYTCFNNALLTPHYSDDQLLASANDVAITLIQLNRSEEVETLLKKYLENCFDNKVKAAAYYNIGLAKEKMNYYDEALVNFTQSCKLNETKACREKIISLRSQ